MSEREPWTLDEVVEWAADKELYWIYEVERADPSPCYSIVTNSLMSAIRRARSDRKRMERRIEDLERLNRELALSAMEEIGRDE